ncbi:acyl-CoA dehydrogenase [candidate division KSB1 bacterium]|nr:acyl-CoA dehydrogenase [candidate division KSB1 bacterium]NIR72315.1 acyl-CoA dehydrogenase [candidate division KSB1 bacterium]NIS26707.1 acyl-CoA dehydrogenase [candidate division KSB1 bacterium]NIT73453.1 acyl-CoA dehydrogenase [candidate division KSB1 bacterium]NIU27322.1 acyl-CoA dehydrogenase [candidate division KSB1 bacterium]
MIDFGLSDEQKQLQALAREFTRNEIVPVAAEHDKKAEFPMEVCRKAWELGLMNVQIPEAYGGPGLGVLEDCIIAEEFGVGCTGIGTSMMGNMLAEGPLIVAGTEEQKKKYLGQMVDEFSFSAYAVTEPDAGSDVASIKTTAQKTGSDYLINGQKMWITNAAQAKWLFVLTYTDPEAGYKGMTAFIVPADTPGVVIGKHEEKMGQRASDTRGVTFDDVKVSEVNRLGNEGDGWKIAMLAFDHSRPVVAAAAVGLAQGALEHAIQYASERKTFGAPIAKHQSVSFMIADMAMNIEAARLLVWKSAWKTDRGERNTIEAAYAKCFAADMAMKTATDAVQVFGGYGYSTEYPVEKLMRDAKIFQIYEGTSQIQRLIISRELFGKK